jgi:hypothetical protein
VNGYKMLLQVQESAKLIETLIERIAALELRIAVLESKKPLGRPKVTHEIQ